MNKTIHSLVCRVCRPTNNNTLTYLLNLIRFRCRILDLGKNTCTHIIDNIYCVNVLIVRMAKAISRASMYARMCHSKGNKLIVYVCVRAHVNGHEHKCQKREDKSIHKKGKVRIHDKMDLNDSEFNSMFSESWPAQVVMLTRPMTKRSACVQL